MCAEHGGRGVSVILLHGIKHNSNPFSCRLLKIASREQFYVTLEKVSWGNYSVSVKYSLELSGHVYGA